MGLTYQALYGAGMSEKRHWICLRCPAGYFCPWGDLPVREPDSAAGPGHQHVWTANWLSEPVTRVVPDPATDSPPAEAEIRAGAELLEQLAETEDLP